MVRKVRKFDSYQRENGSLYSLEFETLDFQPKRLFYVTQEANTKRGNHYHSADETCIVFLVSGRVKIILTDPKNKDYFVSEDLINTSEAIEIPGHLCRQIITDADPAIWGVLVSSSYNPKTTYEC